MRIRPLRSTLKHVSRCLVAVVLATVTLNACSLPGTDATPSNEQAEPQVNVFGTKLNHTHALIVLPDKALLLATHFGIFRSQDAGATWTLVAAGSNQLMDGRMTSSLSSSSINPQRIYVLATIASNNKSAKGTAGLYTSADGGRTWSMSVTEESLTSSHIY